MREVGEVLIRLLVVWCDMKKERCAVAGFIAYPGHGMRLGGIDEF